MIGRAALWRRLASIALATVPMACGPTTAADDGLGGHLPEPTGPHAVGTVRFQWTDSTRAEVVTATPGDRRRLVVQLWYPAVPSAINRKSSPYLPELDWLRPILSDTLVAHYAGVGVSARWDAPPLAGGTMPLLLMSHGLGERRTQYTAIVEELASWGYLVAGIDYPYLASAVAFGPDDVVMQDPLWSVLRPPEHPIEALFQHTERRSETWAADAAFVLDRLLRLNEDGAFAGKLNVNTVGILGHSNGGKAAVTTCLRDPRFLACLNLDGWPIHAEAEAEGLAQPYMVIQDYRRLSDDELAESGVPLDVYQENMRVLQARRDQILQRMRRGAWEVTIRGIAHSSFTDWPLLVPEEREPHATMRPDLAMRIIRQIVVAFFDATLRAQPPEGVGFPNDSSVTIRRWEAHR